MFAFISPNCDLLFIQYLLRRRNVAMAPRRYFADAGRFSPWHKDNANDTMHVRRDEDNSIMNQMFRRNANDDIDAKKTDKCCEFVNEHA